MSNSSFCTFVSQIDLDETPIEEASLDHIVECKQIHDDAGRVLAGLDGASLIQHHCRINRCV